MKCSVRFANIVNNLIILSGLFIGFFHSSPPLYYYTLIELFIKLEIFVLFMSVITMMFGKLFGEKIQIKKEWKLSLIIKEIIETAKCVCFL